MVTRILEARGFTSIDVDAVGHQALQEERERIREAFGPAVMTEDGKVERKKLAERVFNDSRALKQLEQIVHPRMASMVRTFIASEGKRSIVINAAMLFVMGLDRDCDFIFWVTAPLFTRIRRARARDHLGLLQIVRRFWAQRKLKPQISAKSVDIYTVRNTGDYHSLENTVARILAQEGA